MMFYMCGIKGCPHPGFIVDPWGLLREDAVPLPIHVYGDGWMSAVHATNRPDCDHDVIEYDLGHVGFPASPKDNVVPVDDVPLETRHIRPERHETFGIQEPSERERHFRLLR